MIRYLVFVLFCLLLFFLVTTCEFPLSSDYETETEPVAYKCVLIFNVEIKYIFFSFELTFFSNSTLELATSIKAHLISVFFFLNLKENNTLGLGYGTSVSLVSNYSEL